MNVEKRKTDFLEKLIFLQIYPEAYQKFYCVCQCHTAQKMKFSIKGISSVNVTKSAGNWGFVYIYW